MSLAPTVPSWQHASGLTYSPIVHSMTKSWMLRGTYRSFAQTVRRKSIGWSGISKRSGWGMIWWTEIGRILVYQNILSWWDLLYLLVLLYAIYIYTDVLMLFMWKNSSDESEIVPLRTKLPWCNHTSIEYMHRILCTREYDMRVKHALYVEPCQRASSCGTSTRLTFRRLPSKCSPPNSLAGAAKDILPMAI